MDTEAPVEAEPPEELPEFWYLDDPPTQLCGHCRKVMPWSYWNRNCDECSAAYFAAVREAEGRFRS